MTASPKFICSCCGLEHETWPALTFKSPDNYNALSPDDQGRIAEINSDFCVINHTDQTDRFIRVTLMQPVINHCEDLQYGLWVSLSEKSFDDYVDNYDNENHETQYFGWLCNDIPGYEFGEGSIPATVCTKTGNQRPEIFPHKDFDHPFVHDFYNGITKEEAERRINDMLARTGQAGIP